MPTAYADDLFFLVSGDSRIELERKGTNYLSVVARWVERVGVEVNVRKTVCMLLRGRLSANRHPILRVNGMAIRYVTSVKYLGIKMGERIGESYGKILDCAEGPWRCCTGACSLHASATDV